MVVELTLGGILWWIGAFVLFDLIISTLLLIGLGFGASTVKGNLNVTP